MSKTSGNVIDPLVVMDEMGTDALRFTLLVGSTPGNDMNLSLKKVEANRNFANKVWNATRFILGSLPKAPAAPENDPEWTLADSWVWARLQTLIEEVERLFTSFQYGEAGRQIYDFFWNEFADWYLEIAKLQLAEGGDRAYYTAYTLTRVLDTCLRLLHPFTPFVTEELWGHLKTAASSHTAAFGPKGGWPAALIVAPWPEPRSKEGWEIEKINQFDLIKEVVRGIRNLRAEKNFKPGQRIPAVIVARDHLNLLETEITSLAHLARLDPAAVTLTSVLQTKPEGHIALVIGAVEVYLPLAGIVDTGEERSRLEKDLTDAEAQIERLEKLLASPFAEKAPEPVVAKERARLAAFRDTAEKIIAQLKVL
jgi:valyl-tRNA synthetase